MGNERDFDAEKAKICGDISNMAQAHNIGGFETFKPVLNNGNLSETWKGQFVTLAKKLGAETVSDFSSSTLLVLARVLHEMATSQEQTFLGSRKKEEIEKARWQQMQSSIQILANIPNINEVRGDEESERANSQRLAVLRSKVDNLKSIQTHIFILKDFIGEIDQNYRDASTSEKEIHKYLTEQGISSITKFLLALNENLENASNDIVVLAMKIQDQIAELNGDIYNQEKIATSIKQVKAFFVNVYDKTLHASFADDYNKTINESALKNFKLSSLSETVTIASDTQDQQIFHILRNVSALIRKLAEVQTAEDEYLTKKKSQENILKAESFASEWANVFTKESGSSGVFKAASSEIEWAPILAGLRSILSIFHLPAQFVNGLKIERTGTGEKARLVPTMSGIGFENLSTGQKTIFALAWTVVLNQSLSDRIPHRIMVFDDITTSLDLNQIIPACMLFRKLAYGERKVSKRQLFISSHHEDLTNRLLDYLIPPEGNTLRIIEFKEYAVDTGPKFEIWNVNPGKKVI